MAEAMALGKPVIATAYSGNLDFMNSETAYLVPWKPISVPEGCDPYPVSSTWADRDLDAAARLMRTRPPPRGSDRERPSSTSGGGEGARDRPGRDVCPAEVRGDSAEADPVVPVRVHDDVAAKGDAPAARMSRSGLLRNQSCAGYVNARTNTARLKAKLSRTPSTHMQLPRRKAELLVHRRVLITGGAGFIGCAVAQRLVAQGHAMSWRWMYSIPRFTRERPAGPAAGIRPTLSL